MSLIKLNMEKKILARLKKLLIGIIILFFITLALWFLIMNLRYMGVKPRQIDTFYYIIIGIPFSLLILTGFFFIILRLFTQRYVAHYFRYIKTSFFHNGTINRKQFTRLLGIHDENLHYLGFNYSVKEFTYKDFHRAFKKLKKKEKLHQLIKLVGIDEVLKK